MNDHVTGRSAGLPRRLAAVGYDFLLLLSVWFLASFLVLPFVHGEAVPSDNPWFKLYLFAVTYLFYAWFWTHGGQTLGMRAWRMTLIAGDDDPVDWRHATLRFLAAGLSWAALGLGWLWILWDPQRRAWHDRLSGTRIVVSPKRNKAA